MKNILILPIGGTICTTVTDGVRKISSSLLLIQRYRMQHPEADVTLHEGEPLGVLSENMDMWQWNRMLDALDEAGTDYDGIILLHGTDTLAYTAALLSVLPVKGRPLMLCSANRPPEDPLSNADANFAAAVRCILDGIPEGVYAASRNEDGVMYLHQGARLQSCRDAWGNFYSDTMCPIDRGLCVPEGALPALPISRRFPEQLSACVLRLEPYPGLDYASLRLQRYRAVLHGTYHSGTVCVRGADGCSILHLMTLCREAGIPLFIAPGSAAGEIYESTAEIRGKVRFVDGLTQELLYALLTAACSLGLDPVSAITQAGGIIT